MLQAPAAEQAAVWSHAVHAACMSHRSLTVCSSVGLRTSHTVHGIERTMSEPCVRLSVLCECCRVRCPFLSPQPRSKTHVVVCARSSSSILVPVSPSSAAVSQRCCLFYGRSNDELHPCSTPAAWQSIHGTARSVHRLFTAVGSASFHFLSSRLTNSHTSLHHFTYNPVTISHCLLTHP